MAGEFSALMLARGRSAPSPFIGPLDTVQPKADFARGFQLLYENYQGALCMVRRSSDDDVMLCMPTAGGARRLDIAALLAWSGSDSVYLRVAYDQTGNGYDFVQTDPAAQARLVNAGVMELDAWGHPTAVYDGANDYESAQSALGLPNAAPGFTTACLASFSAPSGIAAAAFAITVSGSTAVNRFTLGYSSGGNAVLETRNPDANGPTVSTSGPVLAPNTGYRLIGRAQIGNNNSVFVDGSKTSGPSSAGTQYDASNPTAIYCGRYNTSYVGGRISLLAGWKTPLSDAECMDIDGALSTITA
jgi:hypothetical protein